MGGARKGILPLFFSKQGGKMTLRRDLYYFCNAGKNPHIKKIRHCCRRIANGNACPHLKAKPRKLIHIGRNDDATTRPSAGQEAVGL